MATAFGDWWNREVVPRVVDRTCSLRLLAPLRERVASGLRGVVLEIGFGSGLNLPFLPPAVERVLAVEPAPRARDLAAERIAASPVPVELVGLDGQDVPLEDESVDSALCTFTLCTIRDPVRALREVLRVLRPGGELRFLEHGLSPDPAVARWQHRLTPIQRRISGGCHFDRPIDELVVAAGFDTTIRNHQLPGIKTPGYLYEGVARRHRNGTNDTSRL